MNNLGRTSLLCPKCRKLISADEPVCPYCGIKKPASRKLLLWSRFIGTSADITKIIIYINGALFLLSLFIGFSDMTLSANPLNFLSPSQEVLFLLGATGTVPIAGFGRWWTLLSASFLHGGLLHIFFNMMALAQLGPFVSREFGSSRFIVIYILTGVAGFYLSYLAGTPFTIGASASICGLIGAILYYGKRRGGLYGNAIYRQAVGWVVGLVIFGLLVPGINNWAHGGGIVSGILLGMILGYSESRQETMLHHTLAASCGILTAAVLFWVVMQTAYFFLLSLR
jgi:rhomboid protease GluP